MELPLKSATHKHEPGEARPGPRAGVEITRFGLQRIFHGEEAGLPRLLAYLHGCCVRPLCSTVSHTVHVNA